MQKKDHVPPLLPQQQLGIQVYNCAHVYYICFVEFRLIIFQLCLMSFAMILFVGQGYNANYGNAETGYAGNPYPAYYGMNQVT
jgi:hypothetical protein